MSHAGEIRKNINLAAHRKGKRRKPFAVNTVIKDHGTGRPRRTKAQGRGRVRVSSQGDPHANITRRNETKGKLGESPCKSGKTPCRERERERARDGGKPLRCIRSLI